jgi:thymidine kinase
MAKMHYRYSTMNAGKSIDVIKTAHNYEELNKRSLLLTPAIDDRYGVGKVTSRIGVSKDAIIVYSHTDIYDMVCGMLEIDPTRIYSIVIDEAQFLKEQQVIQLASLVDKRGIAVICYGLRTDFRGKLFEGSKALMELADSVEELKTLCRIEDCDKKATMVVRVDKDGKPIREGEIIQIGGNDSYVQVCRKHFFNYPETNPKVLVSVAHTCGHGHIFHVDMLKNASESLSYAPFNNNLCTIDLCDSVGTINN